MPAAEVGRRSAREGTRRGRQGQRVGISDVELRVLHEHSVRQQVTELCLGPSVHDAVNDLVQVGARVDVGIHRTTPVLPSCPHRVQALAA
jgi:hypothetical protein